MKLPLTPIKSSVLAGYSHNPDTRELTVEFRSGARHVYSDVGIEKAEALAGSASPGSYFGRKIKDVHNSRKVWP